MATALFFVYVIFCLLTLYFAFPLLIWEIGSLVYLIPATFVVGLPWLALTLLWLAVIAVVVINRVPAVRGSISGFLFERAKKSIPKLSKTEEEALNAGDTWLEQSIFVGKPDWEKLSQVSTELSEEEQAFLANETETLCGMLDEWEISHKQDMPEKAWAYIKEKGFLGLVISKEYGGKGFSARAHSDVVIKLSSRCGVAAVSVMVPNSLGPGELLHHYGTDEQKNYYLPRLAKGEEIPCFALTEPNAGSDATSLESKAIVVKKKIDNKQVLGLELTLNKRWITLSPIATLIGLAVNLQDPEGLLKGVGGEGITCLLISRDTENLEIGNRHLPANLPFMNGTIRGENIFVPIDCIIGGQKMAGQGWMMLVECLSIGRSISLPALAAGSSSVCYVTTGAFSRLRRQFKVEIAQFEGIEEKLAHIAGFNYLINATRLLSVAAVNEGKKPSVASAITKYFNTELGRKVINDAMDVHGGRTVVVGPRNYLFNLYQSLPISITVEGANIMSRNLLIFGQGSMACHPFIREEFYAVSKDDKERFTTLIWQHIHYFLQNFAKTICANWTCGVFIRSPSKTLASEYKRLARLSYTYAWFADLALLYLGGSLKRKERLSARLADGLSYLYMAMAALRFLQMNNTPEHQLHTKWAVTYCFYHAQTALMDLCNNFPSKALGFIMRTLAFPWGKTIQYPCDKLDHQLSKLMIQNNSYRDTLKNIIFVGDKKAAIGRIEEAFQLLVKNAETYKKVGDLKYVRWDALVSTLNEKMTEGVISEEERNALLASEKARWDAMQVDEFAMDAIAKNKFDSLIDKIKTPLD